MQNTIFSRSSITQDLVKELFDYDAVSGRLIWKKSTKGRKAGEVAGTLQVKKDGSSGYRQICITREKIEITTLEHRLVFLWHHGYLPSQIDHINLEKTDNRIENLRPANASTNQMNVRVRAATKSGLKGVHWDKSRNKWMARIKINGRHIFLGRFDAKELAYDARKAAQHVHGEYARA